jgi:hypothetical protein
MIRIQVLKCNLRHARMLHMLAYQYAVTNAETCERLQRSCRMSNLRLQKANAEQFVALVAFFELEVKINKTRQSVYV